MIVADVSYISDVESRLIGGAAPLKECSEKRYKIKQNKTKENKTNVRLHSDPNPSSISVSVPTEILNHITFSLFCCFAVVVRAHS